MKTREKKCQYRLMVSNLIVATSYSIQCVVNKLSNWSKLKKCRLNFLSDFQSKFKQLISSLFFFIMYYYSLYCTIFVTFKVLHDTVSIAFQIHFNWRICTVVLTFHCSEYVT